MVRSLLPLLVLLGVVLAHPHDHEDLFFHYVSWKINYSCFGKNATDLWNSKVISALKQCQNEPPETKEVQETESTATTTEERQEAHEPFYNQEYIRELKNRIQHKLSNFTCTLKKMEIIDDNKTLLIDEMAEYYENKSLDSTLKKELADAVRDCGHFVNCLPNKKGILDYKVKQAKLFLRCERMKRVSACMRHDLRGMKEDFDLRGLDGYLDHLDDGYKMYAVLLADSDVGDEDFNLYD